MQLRCPASTLEDYQPEPDVWWGDDGIDAMIWADPLPYGDPRTTVSSAEAEVPFADGSAA